MGPEIAGRLHPATIALQALVLLRGVALFMVIFAVRAWNDDEPVERGIDVAAIVGTLLLSLVAPMLHVLRYRWRLTGEALEIESGILQRTLRRIPVSRIHDLGLKAGVGHRLFGVVTVVVETASSGKPEAELDALSVADAERLVAALRTVQGREPGTLAAAPADPPLLTVSAGALVLRGLTDNRAGLLVVSALAAYEQVARVGDGVLSRVYFAGRASVAPVVGEGPVGIAAVVLLAVAAIWILGYLASVTFNLLTFAGFELRIIAGMAERRHGLLTRVRRAIPLARLQLVRIHQSPVRHLLGLGSLEARDLGAANDAKESRETGTDTFVPIAEVATLRSVAATLLGQPLDDVTLAAVSPRMVRRGATAGLIFGLVLGGASLFWMPSWSAPLLVVSTALAGWLWARAAHARLRAGLGHGLFVSRRGVFGRREDFVPAGRVQLVELARGPLDRFHGVATLRMVVGGGAEVSVANLPLHEAKRLQHALIDATATAPVG